MFRLEVVNGVIKNIPDNTTSDGFILQKIGYKGKINDTSQAALID